MRHLHSLKVDFCSRSFRNKDIECCVGRYHQRLSQRFACSGTARDFLFSAKGSLSRRQLLQRRDSSSLPRRILRLRPRPFLPDMLRPVPSWSLLSSRNLLGGTKRLQRGRGHLPCWAIRKGGHGRRGMHRSLPRGLLLSRGFNERDRERVRFSVPVLPRRSRRADGRHPGVVRYRRQGVHKNRARAVCGCDKNRG